MYIENSKSISQMKHPKKLVWPWTHSVLNRLESGLRLVSTFMPFVTEERWQRLLRSPGGNTSSIMIQRLKWPMSLCCAARKPSACSWRTTLFSIKAELSKVQEKEATDAMRLADSRKRHVETKFPSLQETVAMSDKDEGLGWARLCWLAVFI